MNHKVAKRCSALFLAGMMAFSHTPLTAFAKKAASQKEEIVYVNLNYDGSLKNANVVNVFEGGDIVDYGTYSEIKNLTTTDALTQKGDEITGHTDAEKLYYQGTMENAQIPWNMKISYFMDGDKVTAKELAGASGRFQMNLNITENENCVDGFWEGFALQITMKLDSEKCTNIVSENATIANVGADKQLTYIVLPGKGANIQVNADVEDFQMEAIALNGMNLNLNIDLDTESIMERFKVMQDAIQQIDDGSGKLYDGIGELNDGSDKLEKGSDALVKGTNEVDEAAGKLNKGAKEVNSGAKTLEESMDELLTGAKTLKLGIKELSDKSSQLTSGSGEVLTALKTIQTALAGVEMETDSLKVLLDGSVQIKGGIDAIVNALTTIDEKIELFYETLDENGISDIDELIEYHEQLLSHVSYTDTQKALYDVYEQSGSELVVALKLYELKEEGNKEATKLYNEYMETGDKDVIVDYVTQAGLMITLEKLAKADIKYFEGTDALISGIHETLDGEKADGLMAGAKELQTQYAVFHTGMETMVNSLNALVTNMAALKSGINKLVTNYDVLDKGIDAYTDGVDKIEEGYAKIHSGVVALSEGAQSLYEGTTSLFEGTTKLAEGVDALSEGAASFDKGLDKYTKGVGALYEGAAKLKDGTGQFAGKTDNLDGIVTNVIDSTIDKMTGKSVETGSFVSEKNTDVKSVLFVIKTPPVTQSAAEEASEEVVEEKELTFWQKLLKLFGME